MADLATAADDKVDATDTTVTDTVAVDTTTADDATTATDKTHKADATTDATTDAADWRARMAGDDPDLLKFLGRHGNEAAAVREFKKLHGEIRSGKFIKPLGDDPSEAEMKAYREAMGVPEKPEGYLEKLSGGLVVGDDDRPVIDQFLAAMHGINAPAAITDTAIQAYYKIVEAQDAKIGEANDAARISCEEALRTEYGADYRRNINAADAHLGTLPADVQAAINEGFNGKGVPLKSDPALMQWLVSQALDANPLATVVPGAGANQASAIADEIATIEKVMRDNRPAYNKDQKMQDRLLELITARDKLPKD